MHRRKRKPKCTEVSSKATGGHRWGADNVDFGEVGKLTPLSEISKRDMKQISFDFI